MCRNCGNSNSGCGGCSGDTTSNTNNYASVQKIRFTPSNMNLSGNQRSVLITIIQLANAPVVMAQYQAFRGRMIESARSLRIPLNLRNGPIQSLVNVTAININDNSAIPGMLKMGGNCEPRIYKLPFYKRGRRGWSRDDDDDSNISCDGMFRAGELVSMEGTTLVWNVDR